MLFNKPDLTRLWAGTALPSDVVDPDSITPGKYSSGWSAEIPPFEYFNFLQQQFSGALGHINQRGFAEWDTNTEYVEGAVVRGSDGFTYMSITSPNTGNNPVGDISNTNWSCLWGLFPGTVREIVYDTPGSFTYIPDIDVRSFEVECIGGGGAAANVIGTVGAVAATGGGGGAYVKSLIGLGTSYKTNYDTGYSLVVGAGGIVSGAPGESTTCIDNAAGSALPNMGAGGGINGEGGGSTTSAWIRAGAIGGSASGGTIMNTDGSASTTSIVTSSGGGELAALSSNGFSSKFPYVHRAVPEVSVGPIVVKYPGQGGVAVATEGALTLLGSNGNRGAIFIKEYR